MYIDIPGYGNRHWKSPVATAATLPTIGNQPGDVRVALDTFSIYVWNGSAWITPIEGAQPAFGLIQTPFGTYPTATVPTDTVTFTSSNSSITITGNSGTDTVNFIAASGAGSPLTTKGDVYGFSTVNARIPVGSNNQVLTADSTQTLGVKWATPVVTAVGNLTDVGTDGITITGGTGAVVGSGTSIAQHVADTTHNGYLSSTDWNTFNNKQAALTLPLSLANGGAGESNVITVDASSGTVNALATPTGVIHFNTGTPITLNGMVSDGTARRIILYSFNADHIINAENAAASAANRFHFSSGVTPLKLGAGQSLEFIYNTSISRWVFNGVFPPIGVAGQIFITNSGGVNTINLPQNLDVSASPVFLGLYNTTFHLRDLVVDLENYQLIDSGGGESIGFDERVAYSSDGAPSWDYENRQAFDDLGNVTLDWNSPVTGGGLTVLNQDMTNTANSAANGNLKAVTFEMLNDGDEVVGSTSFSFTKTGTSELSVDLQVNTVDIGTFQEFTTTGETGYWEFRITRLSNTKIAMQVSNVDNVMYSYQATVSNLDTGGTITLQWVYGHLFGGTTYTINQNFVKTTLFPTQ